MKNEIINIYCLHIFIFLKLIFLYSGTSIFEFNIQFILSNLLIIILTWLNIYEDTITEETREILKFFSHSAFISICISLVCNFIVFFYDFIFYFGFVNTLIMVNIVSMFLMSGLVQKIKSIISVFISKFDRINGFLTTVTSYCEKHNIVTNTATIIKENGKYFLTNYVWEFIKILFNNFLLINNELSANQQSRIVKNGLTDKYNNSLSYISDKHIKPYAIKSLQNKFMNDNPLQFLSSVKTSGENQYKNNVTNQNITMNFLKNTTLSNNNDLDDLDEDIDLSNVPDVSEIQIAEAELLDKEINNNTKKEPTISPENLATARKAALSKKIAEKKNARNRGDRNKKMQQGVENLQNMPGMDQLMESMMKDENFGKFMKNMQTGKINKKSGLPDVEQMKKFLQSLEKPAQ